MMKNMVMIAFIERFEDKWYWRRLNQKAIDCLPKLSLEDIDEVISHHFPLELLAKQAPEPIKPTLDDLDEEHYYDDNEGDYYGEDGYLGWDV